MGNKEINISPRYDHQKSEKRIYNLWEKSGYFNPDNLKNAKKPYCIIMPPPNSNGSLHLGHAVFTTIEDILIRFYRMKGRKTLWLPGADHAGFETQVVFDKKLSKEGRNRFSIKREKLWEEIWDFTQSNKKLMESQIKKLGASCDWSREKFTLDKDIIKIVYETFERLYKDNLVYRDIRVVNWCPKHKTSLSDLEVRYIERKDPLYYIKYGPLSVATVRPETKFGDTALAVNPKDKRYKKYINKEIEIKDIFGTKKMKVIAHNEVDPGFGTGVVKITPAHDPLDFKIWQDNKGKIDGPKIVIDEDGRLTEKAGKFKGLKTFEAREKVVEEMRKIGILEKIDNNYKHQISVCYKCGTPTEPIPKLQWFIKTKPLAKEAIKAVKQGKIKFYPSSAKKVYFHWLNNIRDWNISRQIVWGIRIPVWFCKEQKNQKCRDRNGIIISAKPIKKCPYCKSSKIEQDKDVFDTWFSSGQWPFATLMSTKPKNRDFKTFYPTDVMETGYDILFFWVARMIMLGLYRTKKVPFKNVYLHGLVRDKDRQKMSKSKGNVIDPLGVAEIYGTDAVRMALIIGNKAGRDIIISEQKIKGYRNFATKIWNIARFILINKQERKNIPSKTLSKADIRNLKEFKKTKLQIEKHIEKMQFHLAAEKAYHYVWHIFADKIIEFYKPSLKSESKADRDKAYYILEKIFLECIKVLHPFMPFITEEVYQKFRPGRLLMVEKW